MHIYDVFYDVLQYLKKNEEKYKKKKTFIMSINIYLEKYNLQTYGSVLCTYETCL